MAELVEDIKARAAGEVEAGLGEVGFEADVAAVVEVWVLLHLRVRSPILMD